MKQKLGDALRRADCALAGAIFLSLSAVAATAALNPTFDNAPAPPRVLLVVEKVAVNQLLAPPIAPDVLPLPRPRHVSSPMRIEVALENLAEEASCLADAMYYEARGEGLRGEKAIAEVIVHRSQRSGFPHTICGVVHQGEGEACQFSFVCDGAMGRPKDTADWSRAVRLATRILSGSLPLMNATDGAIAFHAASVQPDWPGMVQTTRIGNHVFYRRPARRHSV